MRAKTICFSLLLGMLAAVAQPAIAGVTDQVRKDFAKAVYSGSPQYVHDRNPQPLLKAVVVLSVKLDEQGRWVSETIRSNDEQPKLTARAIESVQRAAPVQLSEADKAELQRNGMIEAWLFDDDGSFQVKTLAKQQRVTMR